MKRYFLIIIVTFLFLNSCQKSSTENVVIQFKTYPSWHESLTVELNTETKELTYIKSSTWMFRKRGEEQKVFHELDSATQVIAKKYSNIDFKITKTLSKVKFNRLYNALQFILENDKEDTGRGLDGMVYYITSTSSDTTIVKEYHSPQPNQKKVAIILNIVKKTFEENIVVQLNIENVERYTTEWKNYKILSKNPLYIRVLEDFNPNFALSLVKKLPEADSIYVDLINYDGNEDSLLIDAFHKKYPKVEWIVPPSIWFFGNYLYKHEWEVY